MEELGLETRELLERLNAGFPRLGTKISTAGEARRQFEALKAPTPNPTPVGEVADFDVTGGDGRTIAVRVYTPTTHSESVVPRPVLLFLHGGGWVLGDLDSHDELVRRLTQGLDVVTVSVDYRLAPEHPYPAGLMDAYEVLTQLSLVTGGLGGDASRVLVAGDSAGGNLATALCLLARDRSGPRVCGQLLMYPAVDDRCVLPSYQENGVGFYITHDHMTWFWEQYLVGADRSGHADYAAPLHCSELQDVPPAFIAVGELDPLRDESVEYARLLASAGNRAQVKIYPGAFHGFLGFPELLPVAREAFDEIIDAGRTMLGRCSS